MRLTQSAFQTVILWTVYTASKSTLSIKRNCPAIFSKFKIIVCNVPSIFSVRHGEKSVQCKIITQQIEDIKMKTKLRSFFMGLKCSWPADIHLIRFKISNIFHSCLFSCVSTKIKSPYIIQSALMFNPLLFVYKINLSDYNKTVTKCN